ncbi:hypothetical protein B0T20DRAFT_475561 [Sordaria brevicollis]|uniref:F-box domain-containing protein n=1 Tax=Sordaria brevicollis TaxID=83679 RepID=A0AAE0UFF8_SORBR|nr:hypothetical protein B0T20DRAFT_475561 [Sordaria brevicollis]
MSTKNSSSERKAISFLDLPLEIRILIYHEVLYQPDTLEISRYRSIFECLQDNNTIAILSLNHQTRAEALEVFYSENTFRIVADEENEDLLSKLPQADRLPIRRLELTHPVIASSPGKTMLYKPDVGNKAWTSIFSNLKSLCIIVVEPSRLPVHEEVEQVQRSRSMISLGDVKNFYSQLVAQSLENSRSTLVSMLTLRI